MSKENKLSVLTLTTQYANNMGALLQCHAIAKYLITQENVECQVLQYRPIGYNKSWTFFNKPHSLRDFVKKSYFLINPNLLVSKIKKQKIMRKFISDYIPLSDRQYKRIDIERNTRLSLHRLISA